jgi:hypothetical protein
LPRVTHQQHQGTVLEADGSEMARELASADRRGGGHAQPIWERIGSPTSWAWGIGLSALCAALILGLPIILRSGSQPGGDAQPANADDAPSTERVVGPPDVKREEPKRNTASVSLPPPQPPTPPALPEAAVGLLGIRADNKVVMISATAWACRPNAVICPTAMLNQLESALAKEKENYKQLDTSVVICTPGKTLAILKHTPGKGAADGFSLVQLEGALEAVCTLPQATPSLEPGQSLTVLRCRSRDNGKPETIERQIQQLIIERIERSADKQPFLLHCRSANISGDVQGSPVFNTAGAVIGCAQPSAGTVQVVPIARLMDLLPANE